jgi:hypothetical protein
MGAVCGLALNGRMMFLEISEPALQAVGLEVYRGAATIK